MYRFEVRGGGSVAAVLFWATLLVLSARLAEAEPFDFSGWNALLQKHVRSAERSGIKYNAVDYAVLKTDPEFLRLTGGLAVFDPAVSLKTRGEQLAFWINVYNIMAVKVVLDHFPLKSIKDAGNILQPVWDRPAGAVGGAERTLGEIEHGILRKMGEPRIHFAIVCASLSCPDLRREAYDPARLSAQLDDQTAGFLRNPAKGMRLDRGAKRVYLSPIFKWFAGDFNPGGVLAFVAQRAPEEQRPALTGATVSHLDYDWSLNSP